MACLARFPGHSASEPPTLPGDRSAPTPSIDEADIFLKRNDELRGAFKSAGGRSCEERRVDAGVVFLVHIFCDYARFVVRYS
jgi:hypothetical protein